MSPTRWVLPRALSLSLLAAMFGAATASAQFFDPALRALDLSTGPVARSPRLLGMGGLVLAVPDRDASIELWDFAGMPVGLAADDTTSTLDLRPGTDALSSVSHLPAGRERQELAARSTLAQMEAVYRNHDSGSMFAVVGDVSSLRWDRPFSRAVEVREGLLHPQIMPVLGGVVPRILSGHLAWATHLRFRSENVEDHYRLIVANAAGEYIDLGGGQLPPPGQFAPTNTDVTTTAFGLSTAYTMGRRTRLGLGIEHENNHIEGRNDLPRSSSETSEPRPYWIGQAALVGGFGRTFEYGRASARIRSPAAATCSPARRRRVNSTRARAGRPDGSRSRARSPPRRTGSPSIRRTRTMPPRSIGSSTPRSTGPAPTRCRSRTAWCMANRAASRSAGGAARAIASGAPRSASRGTGCATSPPRSRWAPVRGGSRGTCAPVSSERSEPR